MKEKFRDSSLSPRERAEDLLGRLSTREKVGQLNQRLYGFHAYECREGKVSPSPEFLEEVKRWGGLGVLYGLYRADPWSGRYYENGLWGERAKEAYNLLQRIVIENSRFGIPMLLSTECPHGHQALDGYLLPVNLAMGAAFRPELAEQAYRVCADQLAKLGVDLALISMLDVLRDPRWGRSEECFGEDPYLAARYARAVVKGMRSGGVGVVAKHFAAQGETTGGVNASAARIGERELREIHFPPMAAAAEAGAAGVMAAYNEIDGIPCHANPWLLGQVLREEMGFDGIVMADGFAVDRLEVLTQSTLAAGAQALNAGVDVSLWDEGFTRLEEALEKGLISEERLDEAVLRVLELKFERGLFEHPYLGEDTGEDGGSVQDAAGCRTEKLCCGDRQQDGAQSLKPEQTESLELARESVILLKNQGEILPLPTDKPLRIALIHPGGEDVYSQLGDYTPPVREESYVTLEQGLKEAVKRYPQISLTICGEQGTEEGCRAAALAASQSDMAVLLLGGSSSRFGEVVFDKNGAAITQGAPCMDCGEGVDLSSLQLPADQLRVAQAVYSQKTPVITIINAGRPYDISQIAERSEGILYSFYSGPWGGQALAEILLGEVSPSGRLPASLPSGCGRLPVYYNYRASYDAMHYCDGKDGALYSFGYGLGYGEVSYSNFQVTDKKTAAGTPEEGVFADEGLLADEQLFAEIRFRVENTTDRQLWAVPMLFISRRTGCVVPRAAELKGFTKVLLNPQEVKELCLKLTEQEMRVWGRNGCYEPETGAVILEIRDGNRKLWTEEIQRKKD